MTDTVTLPVDSIPLPIVRLQLLNGNEVGFPLPLDISVLSFIGRVTEARITGMNTPIVFEFRAHSVTRVVVVMPMDIVHIEIEMP